MNYTRPDIVYAASKLSRNTSRPGDDHWTALLWVVGYLKNTIKYALRYEKYPPVLEAYSDANWITDLEESKSNMGYIFTFRGAVLSCKSSKQTCIARFIMESKFIALDKAGQEV